MSQIKTHEIEGDVAVGRHVAIGGDANVQGSTLMKGNLRVEGWLDAPNIKSNHKGLYRSVDALRSAYPHPAEGWYALVGSAVPAYLYIVENGVWKNTNTLAGSSVVDIPEVESRLAVLEETVEDLNESSDSNTDLLKDLNNRLKGLSDGAGTPGGVATLDSSGRLESSQCPWIEVVRFFGGFVAVDEKEMLLASAFEDMAEGVRYNSTTHSFVYVTEEEGEAGSVIRKYYSSWRNGSSYGDNSTTGRFVPKNQFIYVDIKDKRVYGWDGYRLVAIANILETGDVEGSAFDGLRGKNLENLVRFLETYSADIASAVRDLESEYSDLRRECEAGDALLGNRIASEVENNKMGHRKMAYDIRAVARENERMADALRDMGRCMSVFTKGVWNGYAVWDGNELWIGGSVEEEEKRDLSELIARWRSTARIYLYPTKEIVQVGDYDESTGDFTYYDMPLTEDDVRLMLEHRYRGPHGTSINNAYDSMWWLPAILPMGVPYGTIMTETFYGCENARIISLFSTDSDPDSATTEVSIRKLSDTFTRCSKLKQIKGVLNLSLATASNSIVNPFDGCESLEEVWIKRLRVSISFFECPNLRPDCVEYMITNAIGGTGGNVIRVSLRKNVYEKISTQILKLAEEKNIQFQVYE
ncbi:MAG: hypothetical protein K2M41_02210 [Muribaculaceae bacterium]|nr:hypothetical protein [Muribaculaceae bacterium]